LVGTGKIVSDIEKGPRSVDEYASRLFDDATLTDRIGRTTSTRRFATRSPRCRERELRAGSWWAGR